MVAMSYLLLVGRAKLYFSYLGSEMTMLLKLPVTLPSSEIPSTFLSSKNND